jgi:hypothetical protein
MRRGIRLQAAHRAATPRRIVLNAVELGCDALNWGRTLFPEKCSRFDSFSGSFPQDFRSRLLKTLRVC